MNKTNLLFSLSMLVALVMTMASCSSKAEYTNVIPGDASLVVSFDAKSLTQKCGVKDDSKQKMIDAFKNGLDAETFNQVEKIMKNPDESGVSVNDKLYFFCSGEPLLPSFVAKVADVSKLKEMFGLLEKQQVTKALEEKSGCFVTEIQGQATFVFNEKVLIISGIPNGTEQLIGWMSQADDKSIKSNKGFQKMEEETADIAAFVSMDALMNLSSIMSKAQGMPVTDVNAFLPEGVSLKDMSLIYTLNFEKGKIAVKMINYTENEKLKQLYADNSKICADLKATFMDCFPASTLFFMGMNVNGEALYDYLQKLPKVNESLAQVPLDMQKLIGSFDGDLSVGLTELSALGTPSLVAYAKMKDDYALKTLLEYKDMLTLMGATFKENAVNDYVVTMQGMNIYFGMVDKNLYITTNEATYKNIGKAVADPMTKAPWASEAKKSASFMVINVDAVMQNPMVGMLVAMGGAQGQLAKSALSQISYVDFYGNTNQTAGMNIILQNKDINALQLISEQVEKISGAF